MRTLLSLFIFISSFSFAQDFQGKAYYMSKISIDKSFMDNPRFASRRGYMENMIKRNTEKDLQDKVSINETEMMGKFFLVTDPIENMSWKMTGESKKIGQYTCYKATYEKEVTERVFSFGSQNQNQNNMQTKTVEVSAWFTPEIPISNGPGLYQGLPGLILEVNDGRTTILCTKLVLNPDEKSKIKQPKKGKTISNSDFVALQDQKRQEAREMWQRGRRGGSWR